MSLKFTESPGCLPNQKKCIIVQFIGTLTADTCEIFSKSLALFLKQDKKVLFLDFSKLTFLDSQGAGTLLERTKFFQNEGGQIAIKANPRIVEIFRKMKLLSCLEVYETKENEQDSLSKKTAIRHAEPHNPFAAPTIVPIGASAPQKPMVSKSTEPPLPHKIAIKDRQKISIQSNPLAIEKATSEELSLLDGSGDYMGKLDDDSVTSLPDEPAEPQQTIYMISSLQEVTTTDIDKIEAVVGASQKEDDVPAQSDMQRAAEQTSGDEMEAIAVSDEEETGQPKPEIPQPNPDAVKKKLEDLGSLSSSYFFSTPVLVVLDSQKQPQSHHRLDGKTFLGKDPSNQIQFDDLCVSREHAVIMPEGEAWKIQDCHSTNGTYVNGERITEKILADRDLIQLGKTLVIFSWKSQVQIFAHGSQAKKISQVAIVKPYEELTQISLQAIEDALQTLRNTLRIMAELDQKLSEASDMQNMVQIFEQSLKTWADAKLSMIALLQYNTTLHRYLPYPDNRTIHLQLPEAMLEELRKSKAKDASSIECAAFEETNTNTHTLAFYCRNADQMPFQFLCLQIAQAGLFSDQELRTIASMLECLMRNLQQQKHVENIEQIQSAQKLQQSVIPVADFHYKESGHSIQGYGIYHPALELGGDYLDYFKVGSTLYLFVADVCGKGMDAALVVASLKSYLSALLSQGFEPDIVDVVRRLDGYLSRTFPKRYLKKYQSLMYTTMVLIRWNAESGKLQWLNAGHPSPMLCRLAEPGKWEFETLEERCKVLGTLQIAPESQAAASDFKVKSLQLRENELLLLYTDGVTEAMNSQKQQFQEAVGLEKAIQRSNVRTLAEPEAIKKLSQAILDALAKHQGGAPQFDDITLLLIKSI